MAEPTTILLHLKCLLDKLVMAFLDIVMEPESMGVLPLEKWTW